MDCQKCHQRQANVHITQFVNGEKQELHLCEQCAQAGKIYHPYSQFPIHNLTNLLGFLTQSGGIDKHVPGDKCPSCNCDYQKIAESGYIGCSQCYDYFSLQLEPVLRKIHGANRHHGKIPKRMGTAYLLKKEVEELKRDLKKAVEQEKYEEAATIRDRIKALEEGNVRGEGVD